MTMSFCITLLYCIFVTEQIK